MVNDWFHFKGLDENGDPILVPYTEEDYANLAKMVEDTAS